jgi:hypothetical protein
LPIDLERFNHFKDADFRSLELISPINIKLTFAVQDAARAHDWITITLNFDMISDARLLENSTLSHLDMSDGVTLLKDGTLFAFGIGECYNISTIKTAPLYIIASSLKYVEGVF